jgi:hypothetical protein
MVDQIYRTRVNLTYCKNLKIRVSEPALGCPKKDAKDDKKAECKDHTDHIAVERAFALVEHSYGLELVVTKNKRG